MNWDDGKGINQKRGASTSGKMLFPGQTEGVFKTGRKIKGCRQNPVGLVAWQCTFNKGEFLCLPLSILMKYFGWS
jgi:hypothetical protein